MSEDQGPQGTPRSDQMVDRRLQPAWLADRTAAYLREWERRYRKCWRNIDRLRTYYAGQQPNDLPSWCWIHTDAVLHYYTYESDWDVVDAVRELDLGIAGSTELVALTALAAWRQTKGIYQFDPDLAREVIATRLDDKLPAQALKHLPAWCCYVASGNAVAQAAGFYVFLDWVVLAQRAELVFVFDLDSTSEQGLAMDWSLPLVEGASIREAISRVMDNTRDYPDRVGRLVGTIDTERLLADFIYPALALTLYLCAGNPDVVPADTPRDTPSRSRRKRGRGSAIPSEPRAWEVGWRIGAALRAARNAPAGVQRRPTVTGRASPRPHIRSPHWQSFRVGPGRPNERSDYIVHWIAPIPVNLNPALPDGGLVTNIRPVEQDRPGVMGD
jgi:hypothetical protein